MAEFVICGRLDGLNEYTKANRSNCYKGSKMKTKNEAVVIQAINLYKLKEIKNYPITTFT